MLSGFLRDRELRHRLRRGTADDERFDELFPEHVRAASRMYWTPLRVAALAAEQFFEHRATRVLDVGSGPGKFCLAAAVAEPSLVLTGVEQRPNLVDAARSAAHRLRLTNAHFEVGDASTVDWQQFDGFYFFNPFAENLFERSQRFDESVSLCAEKHEADISRVEQALKAARVGSALITYHGYGGRVPRSYRLSRSLKAGTDWLNVWVKESAQAACDGFWFEDLDEDTGAPVFLEAAPALASAG